MMEFVFVSFFPKMSFPEFYQLSFASMTNHRKKLKTICPIFLESVAVVKLGCPTMHQPLTDIFRSPFHCGNGIVVVFVLSRNSMHNAVGVFLLEMRL